MIDLDQAKAHLAVDFDAHNALIATYLAAAISKVENESGRIIKRRVETQFINGGFPSMIELMKGPVISVSEIRYVDADGVAATVDVDPGNGELRLVEGEPFLILPPASAAWPSIQTGTRVAVDYVAGYHDVDLADDHADQLAVPGALDAAVLLTVGHFYHNRSDVVAGTIATAIPEGARDLVRPYRRMMI